jgi:hypothetical protein
VRAILQTEPRSVQCLALFGSAARDDYDPERSDLDFAVVFGPLPPGQRGKALLGLMVALEELFGRRVDLVVLAAIENPYFRQEIAETAQVVYDRAV